MAARDAQTSKGGAVCGAAREDARLVAALRDGADEAFTLLVADYQTAVYNLAWRLVRDREDARDIAQEVFLKAFRQIPRTTGELRLWAWLYRVTVNACWDHLRVARRRPILAEEPLEVGDHPSSDGEGQAELARVFLACLAQLPPRQQVALLLKDVHGLPHSDIAAALGISRGSSEVLLFRARRSFRNAFTAMSADVQSEAVCRFAERVAAYSVGGRLTEARSRRVLEHAVRCPDCHSTVQRWSGAHAVGLGLALPLIAAPEILGAHAVATAAASSMVTVGASSVLGGLTAKLAGIGVSKAAVVALAATAVVTYGGATVHRDYVKEGGVRMAVAPAVAAVAVPGPGATAAVTGTPAASDRSPVVGDRKDRHSPDAGRPPALHTPRAPLLDEADGLSGLHPGVASADPRDHQPAGRPQGLGPRVSAALASIAGSESGEESDHKARGGSAAQAQPRSVVRPAADAVRTTRPAPETNRHTGMAPDASHPARRAHKTSGAVHGDH